MTSYWPDLKKIEDGLEKLNGAIPELKNSIEKLNVSTSKYNRVLTLLTIVLVVVALAQLITTIFVSDLSSVDKFITEMIALGVVIICIVLGDYPLTAGRTRSILPTYETVYQKRVR